MVLGRAITLVESMNDDHQALANEIIGKCLPFAGQSFRLGITGVPGVGKSTFIESLGMHVLGQGRKLAVLAIDPTSNISKGSILGDKTRMQQLSTAGNAFIRPSPAGATLGGVARKTREVMTLCEAAGFNTVFVETVGVGQSETAVHSMTDFFLLLLLPGGGDELQGIKRGIVEMADLIAVNKSDTAPELAKQAKQAYKNAVHLFPAKESGWTVGTVLCSALENKGISEIWDLLLEYYSFSKGNGFFDRKRGEQLRYWLEETINDGLKGMFFKQKGMKEKYEEIERQIVSGKMTPFVGAQSLLEYFSKPD